MTAQMVKLSDCITLTKGKPPAEMPYFGDGAEPYLSPEYLRGRGDAETAKPAANAVRVRDGDTVLLWDGSNAGEFFRGRQGLLASTMTHIGHSEEFEPEYFCYAAKRWEAYLKGQTSGSGIPHVDKEVLGKLEILKLPQDEQKLVANILSKLDSAIEQTEALIAKQQRIKTGLMQDLLTKGIDAHGNIRSEATHAFKDSPLGQIPVEWSFRTMKNSAEICNNLRKPLSAKLRESMQGEYPYYGPTGVLDFIDEYRVNGKYVLLGEDGDHFLKFNKQEMTILINGPCNVNNHAHILKGNDEVLTDWLHFYFLHRDITYFLTRQGAGRFKLNKATLLDLPLAAPSSIGEQKRICEVIEKFRVGQSETLGQRHKFQSLRVGLLADLLSGRKRVTNLLAQAATQ